MQIWKGIQSDPKATSWQGGSLVMGNFDGLHRGHQALLAKAKELGGPIVVLTFDPHPVQILYPERQLHRLFPREDVAEQLPQFGVDLLVILPFTKDLAKTSAEDFWTRFIWSPFRPKNLIAGHDFAFGRSRGGGLNELAEWGKKEGCTLHIVPPMQVDGEIVSSRGLRELVKSGDVDRVISRMGRPFYLRGQVGTGAGRGQTLGSPTLNLRVQNETLPPHGVYATLTRHQGKRLLSVTNIGINPTFSHGGEDEQETKVETHIIGLEYPARGETLDVDFIERLRPEMKFPSIEDLKKQIQSDILKAKAVVERYEALDGAKLKRS